MDETAKKQSEALKAVLDANPVAAALSDDDLAGVSGGVGGSLGSSLGNGGSGPQGGFAVGDVYVFSCKICGWRAYTDLMGLYDTDMLALDHLYRNPECKQPVFEGRPA